MLERETGARAAAPGVSSPTTAPATGSTPGPTVLTMPDLIADCFDALGEELDDWLDLQPGRPAYRAHYADGSRLDVHADADAMAAEIARVCGPDEAAGYRRYVDFVSQAVPLRDAATSSTATSTPRSTC